jgi:acyl carrier protein
MKVENEVKQIVIETLRLNISPEELDTRTPFLELGLQLDSLTGLKIVLSLEEQFDIRIKAGDLTRKVFSSIDNLVSFVNDKLEV